jgi:SapC
MTATGPVSGEAQVASAPPSLPLFFKEVAALDAGTHSALKLDRSKGFGYAAVANALPLGLSEIALAAQYYPIVITSGPSPMAVAILGYRAEENLFVDAKGNWLADTYIPAYVRAFPFILIEPPGAETIYLGIETKAPLFGKKGDALFVDGKATELVTEAMKFAMAYREDLKRAAEFVKALGAFNLLQANEARLNFKSGGIARLDGFSVVDPVKLESLEDTAFLDWRKRGWLGSLYAVMQSGTRWGQIVNLANGRRAEGVKPE